jgi:hypothetical protein
MDDLSDPVIIEILSNQPGCAHPKYSQGRMWPGLASPSSLESLVLLLHQHPEFMNLLYASADMYE